MLSLILNLCVADPPATHKFSISDSKLYVWINVTGYGTSNANNFTITLPSGVTVDGHFAGSIEGHDNGTNINDTYAIEISGTTMDVRKSNADRFWTTSGAKGAYINGYYVIV